VRGPRYQEIIDPSRFGDIAGWAGFYGVPAPTSDKFLIAWAEGEGIKLHLREKMRGPHRISHVARDAAVLSVLRHWGHGVRKLTIYSHFGCARDLGFAPQALDPSLRIDWLIGPNDQRVRGDAARNASSRTANLKTAGAFDYALIVDVYQDPTGTRDVLSYETVLGLVRASAKKEVCLVLHNYPEGEMCGADVFWSADKKESRTDEGVWWRDCKGNVIMSAHPGALFYPPHPVPVWLRNRVWGEVDIADLGQIGPYVVYKVCLSRGGVYPLPLPKPPVMFMAVRPEGDPDKLLQSFTRTLEPTDFIAHQPTVMKLRTGFVFKVLTHNFLCMAANAVMKELNTNLECRAIMERNPTLGQSLQDGTTVALLGEGRQLAEALYVQNILTQNTRELKRMNRAGEITGSCSRVLWRMLSQCLPSCGSGAGGVIGAPVAWLCSEPEQNFSTAMWEEIYVAKNLASVEGSFVAPFPPVLPDMEYRLPSEELKIERGSLSASINGIPCSLEEVNQQNSLPQAGIYPLCVTNALGYKPRRSPVNLVTVLVARLHADPWSGRPPGARDHSHQVWGEMRHVVKDLLFPMGEELYTLAQVCEAQPKAGRRKQMEAVKAVLEAEGDLEDLRRQSGKILKEVFVKTDELLDFGKKPRGIINFKLEKLMRGLQWTRPVTQVVHEAFGFQAQRVLVGGSLSSVVLFWASGASPEVLTQLGELMRSGLPFVAFAGDDSMVRWPTGEIGESDFRKYDSSQDEGPIKHYLCPLFEDLGVSEDGASLFGESCSAGYRVPATKTSPVEIRGHGGVQMPSGDPATTLGSSLDTLAPYLRTLALYSEGYGAHFEATCQEMGFNAKYKSATESTVTFLRGWWPTPGAGHVPLPSMVNKLGKVLTNPVVITGLKDAAEARRRCATAVAESMKSVPEDYPILGAFFRMLRRVGSATDGWTLPVDPYKTVYGTGAVREDVLESVQDRYGLDTHAVERVERLFDQVKALPCIVVDPAFVTMNADYA